MITIERLSLQLSGLSEDQGRKLARMLAEDLAIVTLPPNGPEEAKSVSVNITPPSGASVKTLSDLIVADLLRQLDRIP